VQVPSLTAKHPNMPRCKPAHKTKSSAPKTAHTASGKRRKVSTGSDSQVRWADGVCTPTTCACHCKLWVLVFVPWSSTLRCAQAAHDVPLGLVFTSADATAATLQALEMTTLPGPKDLRDIYPPASMGTHAATATQSQPRLHARKRNRGARDSIAVSGTGSRGAEAKAEAVATGSKLAVRCQSAVLVADSVAVVVASLRFVLVLQQLRTGACAPAFDGAGS
jgi:hypothetical protein